MEHRTYWVEAGGQWGIYLTDLDETELPADDQICWVEPEALPMPSYESLDESSVLYMDGFEWHWHDDEWHDDEWLDCLLRHETMA